MRGQARNVHYLSESSQPPGEAGIIMITPISVMKTKLKRSYFAQGHSITKCQNQDLNPANQTPVQPKQARAGWEDVQAWSCSPLQ